MGIIIDDENTCECGAYWEDSGYCTGGHLRPDLSAAYSEDAPGQDSPDPTTVQEKEK